MKDLHLDSGGPPGQHGGVTGWRAITRVLRSTTPVKIALRTTLADLTNTLLPSDCRLCGAPMVAFARVRVCEHCVARLHPNPADSQEILCRRCGDALGMESSRFAASIGIYECSLCRLAPPEFTRAVAFANYDNEMREMLHLLKFSGQRHLAEHVLGQRMATAILNLRSETASELVVIPVPLFAARQRQRGFNQATLLAEAALKRLRRLDPTWSLRLLTTALSRVKDTSALYRMNPSERRHGLRGAFRVLDPSALRGREILLIDDIMTTGATARECSRVLLAAGAAKVWVATAARAQPESVPGTQQPLSIARWDATPAPSTRTIEPHAGKRKSF
jgi:ComF family protein